jgi:hypothetical protein
LRYVEADVEPRSYGCEFLFIEVVNALQFRIVVGQGTQDSAERSGIVDTKHGLQNRAPLLTVKCFEQEAGLRHVGSS